MTSRVLDQNREFTTCDKRVRGYRAFTTPFFVGIVRAWEREPQSWFVADNYRNNYGHVCEMCLHFLYTNEGARDCQWINYSKIEILFLSVVRYDSHVRIRDMLRKRTISHTCRMLNVYILISTFIQYVSSMVSVLIAGVTRRVVSISIYCITILGG